MPGSDPVSNTLSTLQSAYSLTKSIADLNDAHAIKVQIGELQTQILSAQEGALRSQERESALARQVHELEERITQMEAWDAEKQRYELKDFGGGTFAYLLKPDVGDSEPAHRICAACYEKGQKSILQFDDTNSYQQERYTCPACKTEFKFGERVSLNISGSYGPRGGGGNWMGS